MFDKLSEIEQRFVSIEDALSEGSLSGEQLIKLTRERSDLEEIVQLYREYQSLDEERAGAELLLEEQDAELRKMAQEEKARIVPRMEEIRLEIVKAMLPKDPRDSKNVILEIRAGTGGEEAGIFVGDLLRMYMRYAETHGWKTEVYSAVESAKGGYKEAVVHVTGTRVFSRLKYESGAHRVQRIPVTESQGRIHTSACTVAILPEAEEIDVEINPADLRIDTYRSSGSGGQHVNTTDSAVRVTHIPTGVVAECQDERSQHKNRDKAMKMLRSRIYDQLASQQNQQISSDRKEQVGSGDRSERIRTYNYPQGRVTDHRVNLTLYKLPEIMDGDLDEIFDALGAQETAKALAENGVR